MGLQGEWWIDDTGFATFADGDIGDVNHEAVAWQSAFGINIEDDVTSGYAQERFLRDVKAHMADSGKEYDFTPEAVLASMEQLEPGGLSEEQVIGLTVAGADAKAIEYFSSVKHGDARSFMMKYHGWVRVDDNNFQMWDFNEDTLKHIKDFLNSEYPEDEDPLEDTFEIEELKEGGQHLSLTGQDLLESGKTAAAMKYSARRERPEWHNPRGSAKFNKAFWKWFGDSKVVDKRGQPLVVYHGTPDATGIWKKGFKNVAGHALYATDSKEVAETYADASRAWWLEEGEKVKPEVLSIYLSIQNPLIVDAKGRPWGETEIRIRDAIRGGHDGVIFLNSMDSYASEVNNAVSSTVYVFFKSAQAKSANRNDGTWDTDDPDIRSNPEYSGEHEAPLKDSGAPLYDLEGIYPADIYGPDAARLYAHYGDYRDHEAISVIQTLHNRPNWTVTVYRAVPYTQTAADKINELEAQMRRYMRRGESPDTSVLTGYVWYNDAYNRLTELKSLPLETDVVERGINAGDWVTIVRGYAKEHGENELLGEYKIRSKKVFARDLFTNGDSIFEFGYDPQPIVRGTKHA